MTSKLYVSNLSQGATLASMRQLFGTCGDVLEVAFAAERSRNSPSAAYVTMATAAAADKALHDLHGRLHGDRILIISRLVDEAAPAAAAVARAARRTTDDGKVMMTQQYRDRRASTYELSCAGKLLTLRFIFPADDAHDWLVEAQVQPGAAAAVTASAMTRDQALQALIDACGSSEGALADPGLDWEGVTRALRAVRAL